MQILQLKTSDVQIPEYRQRKEIDGEELAQLMDSISKVGLLHPIVVREGSTLVVGERRLRAVTNLGDTGAGIKFGGDNLAPGFIPAVDIGSLDPVAAEEAELEENICRIDLTWQERAAAVRRLAEFRKKQAGVLGQPSPTMGEIAREVRGSDAGANLENTRREYILSQHLDNPEVAKAKSLGEAWKALIASETRDRNKAAGEQAGATYRASNHQLFHADCIEWMKAQPGDQFDVICTDPPYGINAQDFGDADGRLKTQVHVYDDSPEAWRNLMAACSVEWYRLAKAEAHLYVCCDIDRFVELKETLDSDGWLVHRTPIVNIKRDGSRVPWPYWGPQRKWEIILYARKGNKAVTKVYPDFMETLGDDNLGHGAQKPVSMYTNLLVRSVVGGEKVLDTFAGTGTLAVACHQLKCYATMVEQDQTSYGIALKRLEGLK